MNTLSCLARHCAIVVGEELRLITEGCRPWFLEGDDSSARAQTCMAMVGQCQTWLAQSQGNPCGSMHWDADVMWARMTPVAIARGVDSIEKLPVHAHSENLFLPVRRQV
jgi:hypothetical protein